MDEHIEIYNFCDGVKERTTPILFVHGGPGLPTVNPPLGLQLLLEELNNFHLVYYDQRGCGKSTRPVNKFENVGGRYMMSNVKKLNSALGLEVHVADIERIRRILNVDRIIIIGHSFGALIASLYAAEFPHRVQSLVLISPADLLVFPPPNQGLIGYTRDQLSPEEKKEFDHFLKKDYLNFKPDCFSKSEEEMIHINDQFNSFLIKKMTPNSKQFQFGKNGGWLIKGLYMSMGMKHDYRPALKSVESPVLIIHGKLDLMGIDRVKIYQESLKNSKLVILENSSHFPFIEEPEAFAKEIANFLKEYR